MYFLLALVAIPLSLFIYAVLIGRRNFQLRTLRIDLGLEKPIRVLHISDLHFRAGQQKKVRFLKKISSMNPDLVINTGDNLGGVGQEEATAEAIRHCYLCLEDLCLVEMTIKGQCSKPSWLPNQTFWQKSSRN